MILGDDMSAKFKYIHKNNEFSRICRYPVHLIWILVMEDRV